MRWFWIDRFTELVSGQSAVAIKSVSLSEDPVDEYAPGRTFCPPSIIIEGMAQTGGLMIGQMSDFKDRVVLAKITFSKFYCEAYPGDTLTYRVTLQNQEGIGTMVKGTSHIGDKLQGEIELMFASLDDERFAQVELFEPAQFCRMIRLLRLFEVGVNPDGTAISVPEHMLEAEKAYLKIGC
ncbi:MAG: 3-hydroxyacyl-[acyl-carrier-protein] dehydratase [Mariniblastus sp.]|jgi:3-hydroxyacyl-[acyl-carrier-protein] dehydratase